MWTSVEKRLEMSEVHYNGSDSSCWTRTHIYSIIHPSFTSLLFGGTWFMPFTYIGLVKLVHVLFLGGGGVKVHSGFVLLWGCSDPPRHVLFNEVGEKTLAYRLHHRWKQSNWITCARHPAESQGHQEKILKEWEHGPSSSRQINASSFVLAKLCTLCAGWEGLTHIPNAGWYGPDPAVLAISKLCIDPNEFCLNVDWRTVFFTSQLN